MPKTAGKVNYVDVDDLWHSYEDLLLETAHREGVKTVAELGGGANPFIGDDEKWGFTRERVVIDISALELEKAGSEVQTRVADLCQPIVGEDGAYDMVFSKMLIEHIPDPVAFHRNCFNILRPGGVAVHFFPTLGTFPILVNRLIPEEQARALVRLVQPSRLDDPKQQKFPAYYRWVLGPGRKTTARFESIGFEVEQTNASFGHGYYRRIPPLNALENVKTKLLHKYPVPRLSSFNVIILRKPESAV